MVGHQAVGMADPVEPITGGRQDVEKRGAVVVEVAEKDAAPLVSARRDVVERTSQLQPKRPGHARGSLFENPASGLDHLRRMCNVRPDPGLLLLLILLALVNLFSLIGFVVLYSIFIGVEMYLMLMFARRGPGDPDSGSEGFDDEGAARRSGALGLT